MQIIKKEDNKKIMRIVIAIINILHNIIQLFIIKLEKL